MTDLTPRDRLLQALATDPLPDAQAALDADEALRRWLCTAYFLADTRNGYDTAVFTTTTIPQLLRQLNRSTVHRRETYQGRVRGRIDWPATVKARYQTGYNPAIYVCRQPHRLEDTPENQLVKFMLTAIDRAIQSLPPLLLTAEWWTAVAGPQPTWFKQRLSHLSYTLRPQLNHVRLRHVTTPTAITTQHILKAKTSKTELYAAVATLYSNYNALLRQQQWHTLHPILQNGLLLPSEDSPAATHCLRLTAAALRQHLHLAT